MKSVEQFLLASNLNNLCVSGTKIGEQAFLISYLSSPVFFVVGDGETAYKAYQQLLALNKRVELLDSVDNPYIVSKYQSQENAIKLINTLYKMVNNKVDIIVLTPQVLNLKLGSFKHFKQNIVKFNIDQTIDLQHTIKQLIKIGYKREDTVQQIGEFAVRGDVIDIFAPNHSHPIRINLFDDLIENIIYFDNINLATISKLESVDICPMKDLILDDDTQNEYIKSLSKLAEQTHENKLYEIVSQFEMSGKISNEYLCLAEHKFETIFDYLPKARLVISNPLHIKTQLEQICNEQIKFIENIFTNEKIKTILMPSSDFVCDDKQVLDVLFYYQITRNDAEI